MKIFIFIILISSCTCVHFKPQNHQNSIHQDTEKSSEKLPDSNFSVQNSADTENHPSNEEKTNYENLSNLMLAFVIGGISFGLCMMTAFTGGFLSAKWKYKST